MKWASIQSWLTNHGVKILGIIVVSIILFYLLRRAILPLITITRKKHLEEKGEEAEKRVKTLSRIITGISLTLIAITATFMVLAELGINIVPLIASFGIAGIAIGFGAQSLFKDLIAGFFILAESQYNVGDVIKIADISGVVEEINLRRTIIRDLDGVSHVVPNGTITVASNYTREWARVNLNIPVGYGTDIDHAIAVINRVCKEMCEDPAWKELILKTPHVLRVDNLGDSAIEIKILGRTKPTRQWEVTGEIRKRLLKAFDAEGIEIPWPHMKVYFGNSKQPPDAAD
jgi:moderate conductance mechanosensitive channel